MGTRVERGEGDSRAHPRGAILERPEALRLLRWTYTVAAFCGLAISLSAALTRDVRIAFLGASSTIIFVLLLALVQAKRVTAASVSGTVIMLGLVIVATITGHGARDLSFAALPFIMLVANLVLRDGLAKGATVVAWLTPVALAAAEAMGLYQNDFSTKTTASTVGIIAALYLVTAITARRLVRAFHEGVGRMHVQELSYRHIFNATGEAIILVNPTTKCVVDVNQSGLRMFGYSRKEFIGIPLKELAGRHQSLDQVETLIDAGLRGEPVLFQWTTRRKDSTTMPVEASLRPAIVGDKDIVLAVLRDASDAQIIQEKLRESEKLQAVGQLAGGIAHDFNNQLTGILANASLLRDKLKDERLKKCADVIVRCSRRSSDLTSQLLAFARRGKHQNVNVDVHDLIREVVELLKHTVDKRITLKTDLWAHELQVQGDPTLLQNAFLNLGLNACDAMPEGGTLSFETSRQLVEITRTGATLSMSHGDYARIVVKDTGEGMDEATQKRIFEPFFTTKATGNGMGLAAVYGTVESHKGDISLKSQIGEGSEFTLLFPTSEHPKESVTLKALSPLPRFHAIRVLVAEDEPDVADATVLLLTDFGCKVTCCDDGQHALELFQENPGNYDLVLVDHMMPRLSGRETLREMRKIKPRLRSIITSGYSNETVIENSDEGELFLPKPFNQEQLGNILTLALEGMSPKATPQDIVAR